MTRFHQGVPHHEPEWVDQTPGQRSNILPGPWPDEDVSVPDGNQPTPTPTPTPPQTFPVFNVAAGSDAAVPAAVQANFTAAINRWNGLIGYSRQQRDTLRASWAGGDGVVWSGSTLWPRPVTTTDPTNPANTVTFTKCHTWRGGTGDGSTIAFCGRVQPDQGQNRNQLSQGYAIGVNLDFVDAGRTDAWWQDVWAHELAHALGMQAACWDDNVNRAQSFLDGGAYPTGRDNYRALTSTTSSNILLDPASDSHWERNFRDGVPGFVNELLVPRIPNVADPNMLISSLTLGVARDQGYQVIGQPEGTPTLQTVRILGDVIHNDAMRIIRDDYYESQL